MRGGGPLGGCDGTGLKPSPVSGVTIRFQPCACSLFGTLKTRRLFFPVNGDACCGLWGEIKACAARGQLTMGHVFLW